MLDSSDIITYLIVVTAIFSYINARFVKLPHTIGLVALSLVTSIAVLKIDVVFPESRLGNTITQVIQQVDFYDTLMNGMLSFLLFAGALQVDFKAIVRRKKSILLLALLGTLISTIVIGVSLWSILQLIGLEIPLIWLLVFGALISPTDPVSVVSLFSTIKVSEDLKAEVIGESLINDGIGIILFTLLVAIGSHTEGLSGTEASLLTLELFVSEVGGGILLGSIAGFIGCHMLQRLEDSTIAQLITFALVMLTYNTALDLHMSGPLAMVIFGLFLGNAWSKSEFRQKTKKDLREFWEVIENFLNSILFLLIGFEVILLSGHDQPVYLALFAILTTLFGRICAVFIAKTIDKATGDRGSPPNMILIWGGIRGAIAFAMALNLPENMYRDALLYTTYVVVIFSIIVQGLTIKPLLLKLLPKQPS